MAKDGTSRGGVRIGAGRKAKSMEEKIIEGEFRSQRQKEVETGFKIPAMKEYLKAEQKGGGKTCATQIYRETYKWLKKCNCAELVSGQIVENFAQMVARHIQAEIAISATGFLSRHPTTGEPMTSPFVKISLDYLKAAQQLWYQISQIVKEHGGTNYDNSDSVMENLLTFGKRK